MIEETICYGYHQFRMYGPVEYPSTMTREGWKCIKDTDCQFNPKPGYVWLCPRCVAHYEAKRGRPPSLPCSNCGTYRVVNGHFEVEDCPNCGDDGFSLCDESGM